MSAEVPRSRRYPSITIDVSGRAIMLTRKGHTAWYDIFSERWKVKQTSSQKAGSIQSRQRVESLLQVRPGYLDGIEDILIQQSTDIRSRPRECGAR